MEGLESCLPAFADGQKSGTHPLETVFRKRNAGGAFGKTETASFPAVVFLKAILIISEPLQYFSVSGRTRRLNARKPFGR
jgi:hypothetical protein